MATANFDDLKAEHAIKGAVIEILQSDEAREIILQIITSELKENSEIRDAILKTADK